MVDFVSVSSVIASPFISLDTLVGLSPNVSFAWQLPPGGANQSAFSVVVTAADGTVAWRSGAVASSDQLVRAPRSALQPETRYSWTVAVQSPNSGPAWGTSSPSPFFTGASAASWAATRPIWAPNCSAYAPGAPAFARFAAEPMIPSTHPGGSVSLGK